MKRSKPVAGTFSQAEAMHASFGTREQQLLHLYRERCLGRDWVDDVFDEATNKRYARGKRKPSLSEQEGDSGDRN